MDKIVTTITVEIIPANKVSTLETPNLTSLRRDGNTTKQIDFAIQKLFEGDIVKVEDHHNSRESNRLLFNKILTRLKVEHNLEILFLNNQIRVDKYNLEIELI